MANQIVIGDRQPVQGDVSLTNRNFKTRAPGNVSVAHLNIRSINTGFDEFVNYINDYDFDIVAVTETWLNSEIPVTRYAIPGYKFVRQDRCHRRGGGVGIYVKYNLKFSLINFDIDTSNFECVFIQYEINKKKILVASVYREPNSNFEIFLSQFEDLLSRCVPSYDHVIFMGDINVDLSKDTTSKNNFRLVLDSFNLKQIINTPTRVNLNTGTASLIDVIITSDNLDIVGFDSLPVSGNITDHNLVYSIINLPKNKSELKCIRYREYSNVDMLNFAHDAMQLNWDVIYHTHDINEKIEIFNNNIIFLLDRHVPYRQKIVKDKPFTPWITDNIRLLMKIRDKAHHKYIQNKTYQNLQYYKQLKNYTNQAIKREKSAYFESLSRNNNSKLFWNNMKHLNLTKHSNYHLPDQLADPDQINNYFISSTDLNNTVPPEKLDFYNNNVNSKVTTTFNLNLINSDKIYTIINGIKTNSVGDDGISIKDLKLCLPFCINPLINILNTCIINGVFPLTWKKAIVKPLAKVSTPKELKDLRPISILAVVSKILERHIYDQTYEYFCDNSLMPSTQSGFRRNHSTSTTLINLIEDICNNIDNNKCTCVLLLDYSKAFDNINQSLLLAKLHHYGFSANTINFFRSYLINREQCVCVEKNNNILKSQYISLNKGVPQGSILGPLLFSIYVADMNDVIKHCKLQQYADDSQLSISVSSDSMLTEQQNIMTDLQNLNNFSSDHNLKINTTKSFALIVGSKTNRSRMTDFSVKINNDSIPVVDHVKNLGITIDSGLTFQLHVSNKVRLAFSRLKSLYPYKNCMPADVKYRLCESLVLSLLHYGDIVYNNFISVTTSRLIQKVQNACMRFSYNIQYRNHITPHLNEHSLLNMKNYRILHSYNLIHKVLNTGEPLYIREKFSNFIHPHNTRHIQNFRIPQHRTTSFQKSFVYTAIHLWNDLDDSIKKLSKHTFNAHVKKKLLQQQISLT